MLDQEILEELNRSSLEGVFNKWNKYLDRCREKKVKPSMNLNQFINYCLK